jgi:alpha-L-fucosidase 2
MKLNKSLLLAAALIAALPGHSQPDPKNDLRLWYTQPAANWNEALPVSNGKLAAMIFGGTGLEQLQLNEETVWAGEPGNNVADGLYPSIVKMRNLVFEKKNKEAQELGLSVIPRQAAADNNYGMPYQPVGNLFIRFPGHEHASAYRRELDISRAVASVSYEANGISFRREIIASLTDKVIIVRLTAGKPGSITFRAGMNSPQKLWKTAQLNGSLALQGTSGSVDNKTGKVNFTALIKVLAEGGKSTLTGDSLSVTGANAATLFISIGTNFKSYKDLSGNAVQQAEAALRPAMAKSYAALKSSHENTYSGYFNRVAIDLGITPAAAKPTDQRVREFAAGDDPGLVSLYFQFGRYLLISSSPPGSQPANLQGKWNDKVNPPWDSKYTININTEMNYWPAEVTNLTEMHGPLFDMISDLSQTGRESAAKMYHARGWVVHHNTDLWRITGPVDGAFYGMWPMGGAWLSQHLWQHFLFTGDRAFLKKYYPILRGAAMFYKDALQTEPLHKWLVVAPSMSPENSFQSGVGMTAGTTMDNQLVFDVLSNVISASRFLGEDQAFADSLKTIRSQLAPMQIGKYGQLQEWLDDLDRPDDKHRHISHLYGLFPSNQVSPYSHPALFNAAKQSLIFRGDKSTGWSMGWKVNWWARLLDGNRAYKLIADQLSPAPLETSGQNGGTYPNLFDAHPPFQIDGNFGCVSGISEMLLQSQDGAIHLLPALPDNWKNGSVSGLMARGGFEVSFTWNDSKVARLTIKSRLGGNCRIRIAGVLSENAAAPVPASKANPNPFYETAQILTPLVSPAAKAADLPSAAAKNLYDFSTEPGKTYVFNVR